MSQFIKAEPGMGHAVIYTDTTGKHFRFSGGTWAWLSKDQCIELAKEGKVDLEVCISCLGNAYLRTSPIGSFQDNLRNLIDKKYEE